MGWLTQMSGSMFRGLASFHRIVSVGLAKRRWEAGEKGRADSGVR